MAEDKNLPVTCMLVVMLAMIAMTVLAVWVLQG
jgi:hypothetical protein